MIDIVKDVAAVWDRIAMERELAEASAKLIQQAGEITRLRAALEQAAEELENWGGYVAANNARAALEQKQ